MSTSKLEEDSQTVGDEESGADGENGLGMSDPPPKRPAAQDDFRTKFKTEMCKNWLDTGECQYSARCTFAHGVNELRKKTHVGTKYKTRPCRRFVTSGWCPYGPRCLFIHNSSAELDEEVGPLITQDLMLILGGDADMSLPVRSPKNSNNPQATTPAAMLLAAAGSNTPVAVTQPTVSSVSSSAQQALAAASIVPPATTNNLNSSVNHGAYGKNHESNDTPSSIINRTGAADDSAVSVKKKMIVSRMSTAPENCFSPSAFPSPTILRRRAATEIDVVEDAAAAAGGNAAVAVKSNSNNNHTNNNTVSNTMNQNTMNVSATAAAVANMANPVAMYSTPVGSGAVGVLPNSVAYNSFMRNSAVTAIPNYSGLNNIANAVQPRQSAFALRGGALPETHQQQQVFLPSRSPPAMPMLHDFPFPSPESNFSPSPIISYNDAQTTNSMLILNNNPANAVASAVAAGLANGMPQQHATNASISPMRSPPENTNSATIMFSENNGNVGTINHQLNSFFLAEIIPNQAGAVGAMRARLTSSSSNNVNVNTTTSNNNNNAGKSPSSSVSILSSLLLNNNTMDGSNNKKVAEDVSSQTPPAGGFAGVGLDLPPKKLLMDATTTISSTAALPPSSS